MGTMQLTGAGAWGPPSDWKYAVNLLRQAYDLGVRLFDTAWYYGPFVTHRLLVEAFFPYPDDLVILTKVGNSRGPDREWVPALGPASLRSACDDDLCELRLSCLPLSLLRWKPYIGDETAFEEAIRCMRDMQYEGKIDKIGLSNVQLRHIAIAADLISVAAISNAYSVYNRRDEVTLSECARREIPYLPYYPLVGGEVVKIPAVERVAIDLRVSPAQVALAWLFSQSSVIVPIPGSSRTEHMRENVLAGAVELRPEHLRMLSTVPSRISG